MKMEIRKTNPTIFVSTFKTGKKKCRIRFVVFKLFFKKTQFFINIDGLEWKRQKWGFFARAFLKMSEAIAVKTADFVIADNQGVANYVDEQYGVTAKMIAYGGDHAVKGKVDFSDGGYAFSLCRIEPENNVHLILEAFATIGFPLKFVGNWNFSKYSRDLFSKFSSIPNIELISAVYDVSTLESLRSNCSYYVHGHSAGGTNPSLGEIMHFSKNIIAFDCSYNRYTLHNEGLYFKTSKQLVDIVADGPDTGIHLAIKNIAVQNYSWSVIHKQYFDLLS